MANRGTSIDGGWKLVSFGLVCFQVSFSVRSIVLCKCSDKYIDIYFILKITFGSSLASTIMLGSSFHNLVVSGMKHLEY